MVVTISTWAPSREVALRPCWHKRKTNYELFYPVEKIKDQNANSELTGQWALNLTLKQDLGFTSTYKRD